MSSAFDEEWASKRKHISLALHILRKLWSPKSRKGEIFVTCSVLLRWRKSGKKVNHLRKDGVADLLREYTVDEVSAPGSCTPLNFPLS